MQRIDLGLPSPIPKAKVDRLLKISLRNVSRLRCKGTVPYYSIGESIRYSCEKLLAALEFAREVEHAYP